MANDSHNITLTSPFTNNLHLATFTSVRMLTYWSSLDIKDMHTINTNRIPTKVLPLPFMAKLLKLNLYKCKVMHINNTLKN